ncbi:hypothetical protein IAG44_08540 [Streptomyces roseirectus]|uniref:Secreted protein n=1 Tax=Streptomyces roseirectus TaxID=2768066 RepID=A0A7H0I9L8_9ACTN|nr:hypothetical protein [Streptomyces roseirectus]QNP69484.1 hypothetical protein IAG44_08540 [Streptomyces roseirectus]
MTQRGRHRRRRRGRALRGFLAGTALALTAAATMISASQATVSDTPGELKQVEVTSALRMTEDLVPRASLDRLAAGMGRPVGVSDVLASGDRLLRDRAECPAAELAGLPVEPEPATAYCWDAADTSGWRPGAVTTSGDADEDGVWGTNRVILSGWSHAGGLAKVAFVDANDPGRLTYSWVLLAVPVDGGNDIRPLGSQLSGMVWYQDKLLVTAGAGDGAALYVFDMNRVQRATVDGDAVGRVAGGWSAHGARFVLPAIGTYRLGAGSPRPDTISLDRSTVPDSLVAAASGRPDASGKRGGARLWRYAFSSLPDRGGLLAADTFGRVAPTEAYRTGVKNLRGVLSRDDTWYVSQSPAPDHTHGTLWRQNTDGTSAAECDSSDDHACWSASPQSLSYWSATGEVWSQSGHTLFALPLASVDRAAKKQWSEDAS